jgi:hypothetical protein
MDFKTLVKGVVQEDKFYYKDYPCVILFMDMGHRCGYVGIPEDIARNISDEQIEEIDCYGGITYGPSDYLHYQNEENITWIGFDTAHYMDGKDYDKVKEYFGKERAEVLCTYRYGCDLPAKTLEYCQEQCKKIVDQVVEMAKEIENEGEK